jgi:hypothetical protein
MKVAQQLPNIPKANSRLRLPIPHRTKVFAPIAAAWLRFVGVGVWTVNAFTFGDTRITRIGLATAVVILSSSNYTFVN